MEVVRRGSGDSRSAMWRWAGRYVEVVRSVPGDQEFIGRVSGGSED